MARNVGPVQVAMAGLYGMLGVKDGSNPDVITGFVQPTIDATQWWKNGCMEQLAPATNWPGIGSQNAELIATVPVNEWWWVEYFQAQTQLDSAALTNYSQMWIQVQDPSSRNYWQSPLFPLLLDAAGNKYYEATSGTVRLVASMRGMWLLPGSSLYVIWLGDPGSPDTLTTSPVYGARARI